MNVTVTDDALAQMSTVCAKQNVPVVRFELKGGGCGGLMSSWDTEPHYEPAEGDLTWPIGEERVFVVDSFTAEFIDGGTITMISQLLCLRFVCLFPAKDRVGVGRVSLRDE